jgi:hypothetical protein
MDSRDKLAIHDLTPFRLALVMKSGLDLRVMTRPPFGWHCNDSRLGPGSSDPPPFRLALGTYLPRNLGTLDRRKGLQKTPSRTLTSLLTSITSDNRDKLGSPGPSSFRLAPLITAERCLGTLTCVPFDGQQSTLVPTSSIILGTLPET